MFRSRRIRIYYTVSGKNTGKYGYPAVNGKNAFEIVQKICNLVYTDILKQYLHTAISIFDRTQIFCRAMLVRINLKKTFVHLL